MNDRAGVIGNWRAGCILWLKVKCESACFFIEKTIVGVLADDGFFIPEYLMIQCDMAIPVCDLRPGVWTCRLGIAVTH